MKGEKMNRNRKGMPEINREIYKAVKKYDRQQFTSFCTDLYKYGYEDGRQSVPGIELKEVIGAIGQVKGIGPKKLEEIHKKLEGMFQEEKNGREEGN